MYNPLIVATPCKHPDNLPYLLQSFNPSIFFGLEWHILVDANTVNRQEWEPKIAKLVSGITRFRTAVTFEYHDDPRHSAKNILLNRALTRAFSIYAGFYFCILKDTNILHPSFLPVIENYTNRFPEKCYVYGCHLCTVPGQTMYTEHRVVMPADLNVIDLTQLSTAQYTVHSKFIGNTRFTRDDACSEGMFISEIFDKHEEDFKFLPQVLAYNDSLGFSGDNIAPWVPPLEIGF